MANYTVDEICQQQISDFYGNKITNVCQEGHYWEQQNEKAQVGWRLTFSMCNGIASNHFDIRSWHFYYSLTNKQYKFTSWRKEKKVV